MIIFTTKTHLINLDEKNRVRASLLYVKDTETERMSLHPLNEYLLNHYLSRTGYNTERVACSYIARFLNWAKLNGVSDISELEIGDFETYMTEIAYNADIGLSSIELMRTHLSSFAAYLEDSGLAPNLRVERLTYLSHNFRKRLKPNIIYRKPARLRKRAPSKIKMIDPNYFFRFLNCAVRTAPEIALGVMFAFSGGLRVGEIVNLSKDSYETMGPYGESGFLLDVKTRNLRSDIMTGEVKKERTQRTIPLGNFAKKVFKMHMKKYASDGDALFYDNYGQPMTDTTFARKFNKVKEAFIKELAESDDMNDYAYSRELSQKKWSTHIGRGTFSNILAKVSNGNPGIVAAARGDSSPASVMPYIDMEVVMGDAGKVIGVWYEEV